MEDASGGALVLPIRPMAEHVIDKKLDNMKLRINARCKDFLEVTQKSQYIMTGRLPFLGTATAGIKPPRSVRPPMEQEEFVTSGGATMNDLRLDRCSSPKICLASNEDDIEFDGSIAEINEIHGGSDPVRYARSALFTFYNYEVDFLHRTVRDFLCEKKMQEMLLASTPKTFNTRRILCEAFLAQIKVAPLEFYDVNLTTIALSDLVDDMTYYAYDLDDHLDDSATDLIQDLLYTLDQHFCGSLPSDCSPQAITDRCQKLFIPASLGHWTSALQENLRHYGSNRSAKVHCQNAPKNDHNVAVFEVARTLITSKHRGNRPWHLFKLAFDCHADIDRVQRSPGIWDTVLNHIYTWSPPCAEDLNIVLHKEIIGMTNNREIALARSIIYAVLNSRRGWHIRLKSDALLLEAIVKMLHTCSVNDFWPQLLRSAFRSIPTPSKPASMGLLIVAKECILQEANLDLLLTMKETDDVSDDEVFTAREALSHVFSPDQMRQLEDLSQDMVTDPVKTTQLRHCIPRDIKFI